MDQTYEQYLIKQRLCTDRKKFLIDRMPERWHSSIHGRSTRISISTRYEFSADKSHFHLIGTPKRWEFREYFSENVLMRTFPLTDAVLDPLNLRIRGGWLEGDSLEDWVIAMSDNRIPPFLLNVNLIRLRTCVNRINTTTKVADWERVWAKWNPLDKPVRPE